MTYEEARAWLYSLEPRGIRLELDRMREACARRGHPERGMRVVHVAGTNGKGSTSAMIESGLRAAGLRTGLYTSPHLHSFGERIRISGEPIAEAEIAARATVLRAMLEEPGAPALTFFEVATLIALEAFRDARCEVAVLEVGLGGRFDATNVIAGKLACVITPVALDHQAYLGETLAEIAAEMAGILEAGVPAVVSRHQPPEARVVIEARARELGCPVIVPGATEDALATACALPGAHQRDNAALAAAALRALPARGIAIDDRAIERGIASANWPGRLERIDGVLLDAAHNPHGARALAAYLASLPRSGPRVLIFGAMADKDWREMLSALAPQIDRVIAVSPSMPRAERAEVIAAHASAEHAPSIREALERARSIAGAAGLVVVAGSIFVLAEARAALLGLPSEPPIGR
jgi:dihydrofolate synthase/folylpolyglutamate synthase